jgi:hypothetical protein
VVNAVRQYGGEQRKAIWRQTTQQEDGGGIHATMPRAVLATMMMMMRRINPCSGSNNATMMTRINLLSTAMTTSNKPSGGNEDKGEQRHTTVLGVEGAIETV